MYMYNYYVSLSLSSLKVSNYQAAAQSGSYSSQQQASA